jgi:2-acylglycerol O-acyltransferase 2
MVRLSVFNVPMHRRLQTAALLCFNWPTTLLAGLTIMVACMYFNTILRYLMLAYVGFILLVDTGDFWLSFLSGDDASWLCLSVSPAPDHAGRPLFDKFMPVVRNLPIWKWLRDYFPISLVKTAELPTKDGQVYLFGYHPHGVLSEGAFINFATNATGFHEKFPGVDIR